MSDREYSSTKEDYDQIYLIFSKVEENVPAYKTKNQQTREKTVMMTRDEDDLSSAIFETRCTENVSVNTYNCFPAFTSVNNKEYKGFQLGKATVKQWGGLCQQLKSIRGMSSHLADIKADDLIIERTSDPKEKPAETNLVFGSTMADHMLMVDWCNTSGWGIPRIVPYGPLSVMPSASVFHYGLEVFEGLKAYRGVDGNIRLFRPMENMKRLHNSAKRISLPVFDRDELLKCLVELVKVDQDWIPDSTSCSMYIRPTIISTEATLGVKPPSNASCFIITGPVGPYFESGAFNPVSLLADPNFVRAWPGGIGECKAGGNYGPTIYAQQIAQQHECSQCLWLYKDEVTEVGTMNIFMYWIDENGEEELLTPPLNGLILPGVTRKSLLELARESDEFKVTEKSFTMQDLIKGLNEGRVKEIFGTGTACVVCPVNRIFYQGKFLEIPTMENGPKMAKRFYKELTDIQYGRTIHEWGMMLDDDTSKRREQVSMRTN